MREKNTKPKAAVSVKNKIWRNVLSFLIIALIQGSFIQELYAQRKMVKGRVTDETGEPLIGASVLVKTTKVGVSTDTDGNYIISAPSSAILVFSYLGYVSKEVAVGDQNVIDVRLAAAKNSLEEVVVVGYGTQRRKDVTGSIVSVKGETLKEVPTANLQQALQGRAAGLEVQTIGTRPGAGAQIRIRGERSINGSNDPLIVLDGVPYSGTMNDINPDIIESVDVLKDGSATAIYGSRGSNGVILITSKRGSAGETRVSLSTYYGISTPEGKYPVFNATQYRALRDLSTFVGGYQPEELEGIAIGRNTDWQELMYKDGYMTDNNLTISGGSAQGRFSVGGGYFKQTAVLPGQDFGRYSLRAAGDFNIGKRIKVSLTSLNNASVTHGSQFGINTFPILSLSPLMPAYNADGTINKKPAGNIDEKNSAYNPLLLYQDKNSWVDQVRRYRTFNNITGQYEIIDGLKYIFTAGLDFSQEEGDQFRGTDSYFRPGSYNTASVNNSVAYNYLIQNMVTYDKTFAKKHRLSLTGLYSLEQNHAHNTSVQKDSITADFNQFYNLGLSAVTPVAVLNGSEQSSALISYMLRANYVYDDRYMITVTGRRDGSSRLGEGNKWHQYPAVAAGWSIHNESFMKNIRAISALKLRVGYAETSNQAVAVYSTLGGVSSGPRYNFGEDQEVGYYINRIVDPNLDWEYTRTINLGLDFGILNNRVTGTIDWYKARTNKLLYGITLPPTSGIESQFLTNVGKMANHGLEVSLSSVNIKNSRGFNWNTDLNFFFNRNKLLKINGNIDRLLNNQLFVGYPLTVIYDYKKLGIWQLDEAAEAAAYGAVPGQIKLEDNNGIDPSTGLETHQPDGKIDQYDKKVIGSGEAKIQGGITNRFSYKGFDLSFVAYARFGGTLISQIHQPLAGYLTVLDGRRNALAVNYWTPTNPTNDFPMPQAQFSPQTDAWTTLGYYDASFIKIRSINFGYNLSNTLAKKIHAQSLRFYVTAQNPFILYSPYVKAGGLDPEPTGTGNQGVSNPGNIASRALTIGTSYPPTRSFMFGINATF
ncbi:TonB-dependent receptor (plasmid) [Pedobacter sp. BS3]|uniref:SusC/RagA family TonB-linked outer membrane protein n=1 Tax=Pedobacter sp. BS3 TaxID=2567937 RepID=UPI0011ED6EBA|nr:TonB-dependent receptor [Pedobacter sp. BS3]TZF85605.1 TonB-dependent receptor [Pedobacter sp. BS3]